MITLVLEALFALLFLRAVAAYIRGRDPIQRDVALVFSALTLLLIVTLIERAGVAVPRPVRGLTSLLVLSQPYFTLRLVSQVRRVPRWLLRGALAAYLVTALPLVAGPLRVSPVLVLLAIGVYVVTELLAALLFAVDARRRAGSPRARLWLAAIGTACMALALLAAGAGTVAPDTEVLRVLPSFVAVLSAVAYLFAFVPPRWLRNLWSVGAAYDVSVRLMDAPPTEPPASTWRRYAITVRDVASADLAIVFLECPDGGVAEVASSDSPPPAERVTSSAELDRILTARQPIQIAPNRRGQSRVPALAEECALRVGARVITAVPLDVPPRSRGALVLASRYRRLFDDDDVRVLGELGTQAGILAERGAVLAEQERLAMELAGAIEALQRVSQAKSDFLASMSHELRTPLNSIIGFSELMRTEEQRDGMRLVPDEWIEHIHSSGRRLLALINDILDLTKVEAGRMELRLEPLELTAILDEAVEFIRPAAERKQIELVAEVPSLTVLADHVRFRQILDNLLSNAVKFTPEGGRVIISAQPVINMAWISVSDTGPGIAEADFERVFEEFQQVGDSVARHSGTGLGLALTRRLVQAHGGKIELQSTVGRGSCFTVQLPLSTDDSAPDQSPVQIPHPVPAATLRPGGVLVIEDEPGAARLLRAYLEDAGYSVTLAPTGEAGLAAARTAAPQAIVLDVILPGIDGWEVLRRLKADPGLHDIPVVIVTVVDEEEIGRALGAVDYFVKPIDREMLLNRLSQHTLIPPMVAPSSSVLLIDDDPGTLEIVERNLSQQGFRVVTAKTGAEGLRLARSGRFDLIICDLVMPDMDGYAVIAALGSDPSGPLTPIVAFTAHDVSETDRRRLDGRVLGVVQKGESAQTGLRDWINWVSNQQRLSGALTADSHLQGAS